MILDDIRRLKKKIDDLQIRVDDWIIGCGAIRYDKERIQTSPCGDMLERRVLQHIEDEERLERLKGKYKKMMTKVDLSPFTSRQQDFIKYYYFKALTQTECASAMGIKISAVCRIKKRVLHKIFKLNLFSRY